MNFIYSERIFEKKSCDKLIDFFEKNKHLAKKGDGGNAKLNNLEINIKLSNPEEFDGLGKKLVLGCKNYGEKWTDGG